MDNDDCEDHLQGSGLGGGALGMVFVVVIVDVVVVILFEAVTEGEAGEEWVFTNKGVCKIGIKELLTKHYHTCAQSCI